MDWQSAFNIMAGIAGTLGGWLLKSLWDAVEKMRDELARIEKGMADTYVRRDDFRDHASRVLNSLDEIKDMLARKVDR